MPNDAAYEAYNQIENGVGMIRSFIEEFKAELSAFKAQGISPKTKEISVISGEIAHSYIQDICETIATNFGITIHSYSIKNHFYGGGVTVTGLLTGVDIMGQLKGKPLGEKLLLPKNLLKNNEALLLDNTTVTNIADKLNVAIEPCGIHGGEFLAKALGVTGYERPNATTYELRA